MNRLLIVVAPGTHWRERVEKLIDGHPTINLSHMGAPEGWREAKEWL